ncbi:MAG: pyridoxal-phosphate dependent enzyme [Phycisphaerales bacterium]
MYTINPKLNTLYCLRCGAEFPISDYYTGCPLCFKENYPANLSFHYRGRRNFRQGQKRMLRYTDFLPYESFPTLGEGGTPVVELKTLAQKYHLNAVYTKNEFQNPTGSHKDRMSPFSVARAVSLHKKCVVAASSGNAGASLAAYAAAASIPCKIISTKNINPVWKRAIELTGAQLILTETAGDRWILMKQMVEEENWYPVTNFINPPVGSNPFGIQGYKTIAYEIHDDFMGKIPSFIVVPTARGDLIWGIFEGFKDLYEMNLIQHIPKIVAVEPFPRISRVLKGEDYRNIFPGNSSSTTSIGGNTVTYQVVKAINNSKGSAISICQNDVLENQKDLAQIGLYLESSSATVSGALAKLIENKTIPPESDVLLIATSNGYKDSPVCTK